MIIPSKFNGFYGGVRRCFGAGAGGAIGGGGGFAQPLTGEDYNRRLQAGETSQNIRNSTKGLFGTGMSDANWGAMVQNAGMNSPTGRPMAGSDQFFQPVYNSQYQNYANPNTQANVSMYGTQPQQGGFGGFGGFGGQQQGGFGGGFGSTAIDEAMYGGGIPPGGYQLGSRPMSDAQRVSDMQSRGATFQPGSMMLSDMQYRGPTQSQPSQSGSFSGFGNLGSLLSGMLQKGGFGQQMQSPFSFQQPAPQQPVYQQPAPQQPSYQQPAPQQPSYQQPAPQQPSYQQPAPQQPVYQQPAPQQPVYQQPAPQQPVYQQPSYQQPSYQQPTPQQPVYQQPTPQQPAPQQPSYQQPSYQQPSYQQPSYQQPSYQQQLEVQPAPQRISSGPTSAIVGRSAGLRGTPNVMQYHAKGGIASLMDDVE